MLSREESHRALRALFDKKRVAELELLFAALDTRSRMSVFRRLRELGYFSSYTHTGRYYTLADIPDFDEDDLWHYQAIGFSRLGTLRATVAHHVEKAEAGCTHAELESLLRVRVHNTVRELVGSREIDRQWVGTSYVYLSADEHRAARQLHARESRLAQVVEPLPSLPAQEVVVAVLVEALQASEGLAAASVVARRLAVRGQAVSAEQVQQVYAHFGLTAEKKTAVRR